MGVLHDGGGQLKQLNPGAIGVYEQIVKLGTGLFSFAHHDGFQGNIVYALPNQWHCPTGGRFLYICEDGLVHYCSQQRGHPAISLLEYTREDILREGAKPKGCAPFCTISCVHQTAMMDRFRTEPQAALNAASAQKRARPQLAGAAVGSVIGMDVSQRFQSSRRLHIVSSQLSA